MSDAKNRTATINKVFNAPVKLVWEAYTNSDHVVQWWAPKGMKINVSKHDFRVGGQMEIFNANARQQRIHF